MKKKTHGIFRDGKLKFKGTPNDCFAKLLDLQPFSTDWAIKHEGWEIKELETQPK